jgi:hypothetical protein
VTAVRIQERAAARLDEIYRYTRKRWGQAQAEHDLRTLIQSFEQATIGDLPVRLIPAEFGIAVILHECMRQTGRLKSGLER